MKSFPLNVRQWGNKMLVRAIEKDKRVQYEAKYKPYLFVKSPDGMGEYKTIHGNPVKRVDFDSIRDAKDFIQRYEDVGGFEYYGMTTFLYPFINDRFPGVIDYDRSMINVVSYDAEMLSDDGFPDPHKAEKEVTAISLSNGKEIVYFSIKPYEKHQDNVRWVPCGSEKELLMRFVIEWR